MRAIERAIIHILYLSKVIQRSFIVLFFNRIRKRVVYMRKTKFIVVIVCFMMLCAGLLTGCSGQSSTGTNTTSNQNSTQNSSSSNSSNSTSGSSNTSSGSSSSSSSTQISGTASKAYSQDFTLVNNMGFTIYGLYVSPVTSDSWEEDILGADVLGNGKSTTIRFSTSETSRYWDLMVTDAYNNEYSFYELDLFSISRITIYVDKYGDPWMQTA